MKKPLEKWKKSALRRSQKALLLLWDLHPLVLEKKISAFKTSWFLDLHFVSEKKMKSINAEFRKKNKVTDILSFPVPSVVSKTGYLGELIVCIPVLQKQAKERGLTMDMEFMILWVHGFLHLLGYDHEKNKKEAKRMALLEIELLRQLIPAAWIQKTKGACLRGLIERA